MKAHEKKNETNINAKNKNEQNANTVAEERSKQGSLLVCLGAWGAVRRYM
jgi:hypothetical protein